MPSDSNNLQAGMLRLRSIGSADPSAQPPQLGAHQWLLVFREVNSDLTDNSTLKVLADEFIQRLHLKVVSEQTHMFDPVGTTLCFILCQSSLTIHTWPEHSAVAVDLISCGPPVNIEEIIGAATALLGTFCVSVASVVF